MPLEGHYERQTTPLYKLSSRELIAATSVLIVMVIAILAIMVASSGNSSPPLAKGCINPTVAGKVGGEVINACGSEAVAICQRTAQFSGERADKILTACRDQEVPF